MAEMLRKIGLWRCRRGHHLPLEWISARERFAVPTNSPQEMLYAAGLLQLAKWNGWCPRCGRAVEWSSFDPRSSRQRRDASGRQW